MKTKNIFLTLALALCTTFAFAQTIVGSAHDLSGNGWAHLNSGDGAEICITCHTPHNSQASNVGAPLWNHTIAVSASFTPYSGGTTLNATVGLPTGTSLLCLSCHDGTTNIDGFGGAATIAGTENIQTAYTSTTANLGVDLSTHHPISFTYDGALVTADDGLYATSTLSGVTASGTIAEDMLFTDKLECASCHDVHNASGAANLLVKDNLASALCLTCHNK